MKETGARVLLAIISLPPAWIMMLAMKAQYLNDGGYRILARSNNLLDTKDVPLLAKAALYNTELLAILICIGLVALATRSLSIRNSTKLLLIINILAIFFFYINIQTYGSIGRHLTLDAAIDALRWAADNPEDVKSYASASSLMKLGSVVLLAILTYTIAKRLPALLSETATTLLLAAYFATFLASGGFYYYSKTASNTHPYANSSYAKSITKIALSQLLQGSTWNEGEFKGLSFLELQNSHLMNKMRPICDRIPEYSGKAMNQNLVVISMETMPAESMALQANAKMYPNINELTKNALIANLHYSSFPYTSYALFSAYTSTHPSPRLEKSIERANTFLGNDADLPSYLHRLRDKGYVIEAFLPLKHSFHLDEEIYKKVGFTRQYISPTTSEKPTTKEKIERDELALAEMKASISNNIKAHKPFAAFFLPQIGHGPWPNLDERSTSIKERGKKLIQLQDIWIGQIIETLKENNAAENTIILIMADHGIRTKNEDPSFSGGMIDSYSFHVPLIIHSKTAFHQTLAFDGPTSHIDIGPTLMNLLGIELNQPSQGLPITCLDTHTPRLIPMFAEWYLGADGYLNNKRYCMLNQTTNTSHCNGAMKFNELTINKDNKKHEEVQKMITSLRSFQERYIFTSMERIQQEQARLE